jgi:hypothetical protein
VADLAGAKRGSRRRFWGGLWAATWQAAGPAAALGVFGGGLYGAGGAAAEGGVVE